VSGQIERYVPPSHIVNALCTGMLVIVGAWGIYEGENALQLTQRAWLTPVGAQLTSKIENNKPSHFLVFVQNSGREPARDVSFIIDNLTIGRFDPVNGTMDSVEIPNSRKCDKVPAIKGKTIVTPAVQTGLGLDSAHGEPPFYANEQILGASKYYVVRGCIAYNTYDVTHHTAFCYVLTPLAPGTTPSTQAPPQGITQTPPPVIGTQLEYAPESQSLAPIATAIFNTCPTGVMLTSKHA
jgi:hypothetical protein